MGSINKLIPGVNDLNTVNPIIASEWNYEKNNGLLPGQVSANTHKKVWWRCSICGSEWEAHVSTRNRKGQLGCPSCAKKRGAQRRIKNIIARDGSLASQYPELCKEWDQEKNKPLTPDSVTAHNSRKVWWRCSICGNEWQAAIADRTSGHGCPKCSRAYHTSFSEQALFYYIKTVIPSAKNSYHDKALNGNEIDIYLPEYRIGIEYDGYFWHKDSDHDKKKDRMCYENKIHLIRLRETDCAPLCNSTSHIIPVTPTGNPEVYLKTAINDLFKYLSENYNIQSHPMVDIERDYYKILSLFEHNKKDLSIASNESLLQDWNWEKNAPLLPQNMHGGSKRKIWWKCHKCGYEWQSVVRDRAQGIGCPACSGQAVHIGVNDLKSQKPKIAAEWNYDKNKDKAPEEFYMNSLQKVWWRCSNCGHEWKASIQSRSKPFCKKCNYRIVAETRNLIQGTNDIVTLCQDIMKDWDYEKNTIDPHMLTKGSHKKAFWKCHKCRHQWQASIYDRANGHGCPECSKIQKSRKLTKRNLVVGETDLETRFPEVALDWDYENNDLTPREVSYGSSKKVNWICSKCGHRWAAIISNRTNRHSQCPKCHGLGLP